MHSVIVADSIVLCLKVMVIRHRGPNSDVSEFRSEQRAVFQIESIILILETGTSCEFL